MRSTASRRAHNGPASHKIDRISALTRGEPIFGRRHLPQLRNGARLDLADTFARDAVTQGERRQRRRLLREAPLRQDLLLALAHFPQGAGEQLALQLAFLPLAETSLLGLALVDEPV